jgi:hypothetical protein
MVIMVDYTQKIGGWAASMAQLDLEYSQYATAILQLPSLHPACCALWNTAINELSK